ncbi:MAG: hypothetical protein HRU11_06780 [Parvularculaceae bacterium]|nr:hypothetical protein [Parvularculaceae bacterium]
MVTQDDLLLLHHVRSHACGGNCLARSIESLSVEPGRAAGKVLSWSLSRVVAHVERFGRRGWRCGDGVVPTAQEVRLLSMVKALAAYDRAGAEQAAMWLVPRREIAKLIERATPLAAFYEAARPDRQAAQA